MKFHFRRLHIATILIVTMIFGVPVLYATTPSRVGAESEDIDEIQKEIEKQNEKLNKKNRELENVKEQANKISSQIKSLSGQLNVTQSQINQLKSEIDKLTEHINNLDKKIIVKNNELNNQIQTRNETLKELYIIQKIPRISLLLSKDSFVGFVQNLSYFKDFVDTTYNYIGSINSNIKSYEQDKKDIAQVKKQVEKQKEELQKISDRLATQVASAQGTLNSLSQKQNTIQQERREIERKLSELSAKQKALLEEKTETFTTSVGDVPTTGDPHARADYDPGFRKAFAAFSFGAPHRKGMSQYGAKGRAEDGQDYKKILKAYYGDVEIKEVDVPKYINTDKGKMELDGKYLYGLAEMPSSWPKEALKAQAVAARTYALARIGWRTYNTNPSGSICTTEACQVWSSSKANSSSAARWHDAVKDTKAKVMISKKTGEIFSAWYAATSGGYNYKYTSLGHTTKGGWDTSCGSKDCWTSKAYESKAGSPWFYKGWYKTRSNKSCGRSHPWLTEKEFADIVGAAVLYKEDKDNQKHLSQPDAKSCWGEDIDDTWSMDKVRDKTGIKKIKKVKVTYSSGGYTDKVEIETNKGTYKFDGDDFKAIFNLRAPGAIHLKSALYNIEFKK